jgi:hypothetical protein
VAWDKTVASQLCPYTKKKCIKTRKSSPDISIGTCTLEYQKKEIVICPHRLLERKQVFMDCIHLLPLHRPGNELHVISEVKIPGGCVDYFLVSVSNDSVVDFVGIEFQTMDTTGTIWPERQRMLVEKGVIENDPDSNNRRSFGMNWKMTAKTILIQMHHKSETFENLDKHLVLVIQKPFLDYMKKEFSFQNINDLSNRDCIQIHTYTLEEFNSVLKLRLDSRLSTDAKGIAECLGLRAESEVDIKNIQRILESKIPSDTLLTVE